MERDRAEQLAVGGPVGKAEGLVLVRVAPGHRARRHAELRDEDGELLGGGRLLEEAPQRGLDAALA